MIHVEATVESDDTITLRMQPDVARSLHRLIEMTFEASEVIPPFLRDIHVTLGVAVALGRVCVEERLQDRAGSVRRQAVGFEMSGPCVFALFLAWQAATGPWWAIPLCWAGWELMIWVWRKDLDYQQRKIRGF